MFLFLNAANIEEKHYFGEIGSYPVSASLSIDSTGVVSGDYAYLKFQKPIKVNGKKKDADIVFTTETQKNPEVFKGKIFDSNITGTWTYKGKSLPFVLIRNPLDDQKLTCQEMRQYPDKVFQFPSYSVDLGSGHSSPLKVDYKCDEVNLTSELETIAEGIRWEPCHGGSIVYALWRYHHYRVLNAIYAPALFSKKVEERKYFTENDKTDFQNYMDYRILLSLEYFERFADYRKKFDHTEKRLVKYFQSTFNVDHEKAKHYTDNVLLLYMRRARPEGCTEDMVIDEPNISDLVKLIKTPDTTADSINLYIAVRKPTKIEVTKALQAAILYDKHVAILKELIKHSDINNNKLWPTLLFAIKKPATLELLLKLGAAVDKQNDFGKTALYVAIENNDLNAVKILMEHGANVNHRYLGRDSLDSYNYRWMIDYRRTPLMSAAEYANVEMMKYLIDHGADYHAVDEEGLNVLDYAIHGRKEQNILYCKSLGLRTHQ